MDDSRKAAFARALEHWRDVFVFAQQWVRDRGAAEDLAQDAFLRLLASDRPLDDARSLRPLLFAIVRNLVRSRARRHTLPTLDLATEELATDRLVEGASANESPHGISVLREECSSLRDALESMRPSWRAALYLADGLGCSYAEIAESLDSTEDVVRTTLHRARDRVRSAMAVAVAKRSKGLR